MKNAKELLLEFTAFSLRDLEKAAAMFREDGALRCPIWKALESKGARKVGKRSRVFSSSCEASLN